MGNIVIAAQNYFGMLFAQLVQVRIKLTEPFVFKRLSFVAGSARGKIGIDQTNILIIELQYSSFFVAHGMTCSIFYAIGFYFGEYSNTAIAFFAR